MRATLGFLETLTLRPADLTETDAGEVLAAGVSESALVDAVHVAVLFCMIVRLADSFGWHVPTREAMAARAGANLEGGYSLLTPEQLGA